MTTLKPRRFSIEASNSGRVFGNWRSSVLSTTMTRNASVLSIVSATDTPRGRDFSRTPFHLPPGTSTLTVASTLKAGAAGSARHPVTAAILASLVRVPTVSLEAYPAACPGGDLAVAVGQLEPYAESAAGGVDDPVHHFHRRRIAATDRLLGEDRRAMAYLDFAVECDRQDHLDMQGIHFGKLHDRILDVG